MQLFILRIGEDPFYVLSWMLIVTFSICVHEFAHAWMALRKGDDTAARHGHLSLNPLVQMGWGSLIMLALFGLAWGAVPVDVRNLRRRTDAAWVSLAGPLANLLLAVVFSAIFVVAALLPGQENEMALNFFWLAAKANAVLMVFNLLPIPMFDGWGVLEGCFPALQRLDASHQQNIGWLFLAVVWMTPAGGLIWVVGSRLTAVLVGGWDYLAHFFV